jgi:GH24 family phage-related lysozyme (muramidase)
VNIRASGVGWWTSGQGELWVVVAARKASTNETKGEIETVAVVVVRGRVEKCGTTAWRAAMRRYTVSKKRPKRDEQDAQPGNITEF